MAILIQSTNMSESQVQSSVENQCVLSEQRRQTAHRQQRRVSAHISPATSHTYAAKQQTNNEEKHKHGGEVFRIRLIEFYFSAEKTIIPSDPRDDETQSQ